MPRPSLYSPAMKADILHAARQHIRQGMTIKDAALALCIPAHSLRGWLREQAIDMVYPRVEASMNPRARR